MQIFVTGKQLGHIDGSRSVMRFTPPSTGTCRMRIIRQDLPRVGHDRDQLSRLYAHVRAWLQLLVPALEVVVQLAG